MEITFLGNSSFKVKTKNATIEIGEDVKLINNLTSISKTIFGPGEYEIGGVSIMGYKNNVYVYEFEKLRLCSINGEITKDLVGDIGDVDILLLGNASKEIFETVSGIEPYFIIASNADTFKDSGMSVETLPKFVLKKEDILEDQNTKIIVLEKK